jgi:lipopolysaccharide biosynthesis glycosyltransferase
MKVDIAFSLNSGVILGLLAAMNSIAQNAAQPERLRFSIAVPVSELTWFEKQIQGFFPNPKFEWRLGSFTPPDFLQDYLHSKFAPKTADRATSRYMQYARLFLQTVFSDLGKVIYLDADVVVLGDIATLFDSREFASDRYFAAVPHFYPAILYFGRPFKAIAEVRKFHRSFNSGLIFTDFRYWDEETYRRFRHYMAWDATYSYRMLNLGDETILNLMFKDYIPLDPSWNRCGYGNIRPAAWFLKKNLKEVNLIHWSGGHHKPWRTRNIVYGDIWRKYATP